jgi:drug/metabolite transporter (DMT)-like permease
MYYISILIVIISNIIYHISQKSISKTLNPMISMIVTYSTALIITFIILLIFPVEKSSISTEIKSINWASVLLGMAVVGLETGFLLMYRSGWNISFAAIFSNVIVTLLLIPVGMYFFKDKITLTNTLGVILSIVGIFLINKK